MRRLKLNVRLSDRYVLVLRGNGDNFYWRLGRLGNRFA